MEFPDLGQHCSLPSCKILDFLPFNCDACHQIFCKDHFEVGKHNCQAALLRDVRVPVCPLCEKPVPVGKGKNVDEEVSRHIDQNCQSDPAKEKRKAYSNRCSMKGCKQKELMKILCTDCRHNYCLRHRHPQDHECGGKQSASSSASSTAYSRNSRAKSNNSSSSAARYNTGNKSNSTSSRPAATYKPQRTMMSSMGSELNRERQQRQAQQQSMTEDEQMALALQRSLNENPTTTLTQEEMDLQLAQQLQQEETARTRRTMENQQRRRREEESSSSCNIV